MVTWAKKINYLNPILSKITRPAAAIKSLRFALFYLRLNKRLSKQSWGWWFETPSCSLWRHCNVGIYPNVTRLTILRRCAWTVRARAYGICIQSYQAYNFSVWCESNYFETKRNRIYLRKRVGFFSFTHPMLWFLMTWWRKSPWQCLNCY